jgi:peptidoglycan hydrolase-like protein with peptidoglycan-binding domain
MTEISGEFPKLIEFKETPKNVQIDEADAATVKEIQLLLNRRGIYSGDIDGIAGVRTIKSFAEFKEDVWLASPKTIGPSTVDALLEIAVDHIVSEQASVQTLVILPPSVLGTKAGRTMRLPNGDTVYEQELIVEGIPLTWGEFTKGCSRVPVDNQVVANIIRTAKAFGKIRQAYGSPLYITSGYRPPAVNRSIGGARYSQHIYGLALDISPVDGNIKKLFEVCRSSSCVGLGKGMHKGFVHIDWRSGGRVIFSYP